MKALILSIRPEHALNILNGHKTLELRKSVPKDFKGWVYVYVTKGKKDILYKYKDKYYTQHYLTFTDSVEVLNSKVVARWWHDEVENVFVKCNDWVFEDNITDELLKKACLTYEELFRYLNIGTGYAWHIKNLDIFDKPMQLSDFIKDFPYASRVAILSEIKNQKLRITKAPQSYMYAWVKEEIK